MGMFGLLTLAGCGGGPRVEPPRTPVSVQPTDVRPVSAASTPSDTAATGEGPIVTASASEGTDPHAPPPMASAHELTAFLAADRSDKFLVHAESGAVVLRSSAAETAFVLVPRADVALYDPALELIWFIASNQLSVLDLRKPAAAPVMIVRDMHEIDKLRVMREGHLVSAEDGCEAPYAVLEWTASPTLKAFLVTTPPMTIDDEAWLRAQLKRPARAVKARRDFGLGKAVRMPKKLLDCDVAESCASTAPFGPHGWQLVLVYDKAGGDCSSSACVLHDPQAKRFASLPSATSWGPASSAIKGPCGLYFFNEPQTAYLVTRSLCQVDGTCQSLGGYGLGWLMPGETSGKEGDWGEAEDGE
jgi:hypothetical protein